MSKHSVKPGAWKEGGGARWEDEASWEEGGRREEEEVKWEEGEKWDEEVKFRDGAPLEGGGR